MQTPIQVVKAVIKSEGARKRILKKFKDQGYRFFSDWVLWKYHLVADNRLCLVCGEWIQQPVVIGSKIRLMFPWLVIVSVDKILVNQHPNCRCWLERR